MTISTKDGRKGPNDKIIFYNGLPISIKEVTEILIMLCDNEDQLYPPPRFKGSKMLMSFVNEALEKRQIDDDLLRKYKLIK